MGHVLVSAGREGAAGEEAPSTALGGTTPPISSLYVSRYKSRSIDVGGMLESLEGLLDGEEGIKMDQEEGAAEGRGAPYWPYSEVLAWLDRHIIDPSTGPFGPSGLLSGVPAASSSSSSGDGGRIGGASVTQTLTLTIGGASVTQTSPAAAGGTASAPGATFATGPALGFGGSILSPRRLHREAGSSSCTPVRTQQAISSLSSARPTIIQGFTSTFVQTVSTGPARSRLRKASKGPGGVASSGDGGRGGSGAEESDERVSSSSGLDASPPVAGGSGPSRSPSHENSDGEAIDLSASSSERGAGPLGSANLCHQTLGADLRRSNSLLSTMSISDHESHMSVHHSESEVELDMEVGGEEEGGSGGGAGTGGSVGANGGAKPGGGTALPTLQISNCSGATIYLLSPYRSALITHCTSCLIVIGAVAGPVHIASCDKCRITVMCKKCIVFNSLDCEINLATMLVSVTSGDSRGLVFGPLNVAYRSLHTHACLAGLQSLVPKSGSSAAVAATSSSSNMWATLCDISLCVDAVATFGSPSGNTRLTVTLDILPISFFF